MLKKYFFCFLLVFNSLLSLLGQELKPLENSKEFISKLKSTSSKTTSIKADFTEGKHLSFLKEAQRSSGIFYYKKDDKIRWEQVQPFKYILLINDKKVRVKENEKEKDVIAAKRMVEKIKELMLSLVTGTFSESKAFKLSYFQTNSEYVIFLNPTSKKMKDFYDKIQLNFSKESLHLTALSFYEKGGDKSIMKFFNHQINVKIEDEVFSKF